MTNSDPSPATVGDIYHRLGTIEAKIDSIADLPKRISSLENSRSFIKGLASLSIIISAMSVAKQIGLI